MVGTLLSALQLPINMIWIFILFVICAIIYFILIQKELEASIGINIIVASISLCFSGIIASELGIYLGLVVGYQYIVITMIVVIFYYLILSWILFRALKIGKIIQKSKKERIKKEKLSNKSIWNGHSAFVKNKIE